MHFHLHKNKNYFIYKIYINSELPMLKVEKDFINVKPSLKQVWYSYAFGRFFFLLSHYLFWLFANRIRIRIYVNYILFGLGPRLLDPNAIGLLNFYTISSIAKYSATTYPEPFCLRMSSPTTGACRTPGGKTQSGTTSPWTNVSWS